MKLQKLIRQQPTTGMGQALLAALDRQTLAKSARNAPKPARWFQPVIDANGKTNEVATLIKAAHHQRRTIHRSK